jgi:large subunit ribosomal protein L13
MERCTKAFDEKKVKRQWFVVDVAGVPLGRAASRVASILRGKHKPEFTYHSDVGDFVIVVNAGKARLTGAKAQRELFRWHSGYLGSLRERPLGKMLEEKPEYMFWRAVRGMLPKGPLGRKMLRKLKVYRGAEHPHQAQKPKSLHIDQRFILEEATGGAEG